RAAARRPLSSAPRTQDYAHIARRTSGFRGSGGGMFCWHPTSVHQAYPQRRLQDHGAARAKVRSERPRSGSLARLFGLRVTCFSGTTSGNLWGWKTLPLLMPVVIAVSLGPLIAGARGQFSPWAKPTWQFWVVSRHGCFEDGQLLSDLRLLLGWA